ncbi:hypothetical protein [Cohnella luojiensis]|uniref:Spore coat protein n=1 Tax=Cohnella luojiensis TaxID=652876 RepID=A0A4Y8LUN9_9BACL|nr:hypothetical protein [Cohnella luojiensis]TFE25390.1 hypothetical protein E2980_13830 [Cohnella luojiensis]
MFKWVSWVIRMGATALLLSFLCIWTTGYIVNSYMESVIKQLDLPIDIQPIALSGMWGGLWGADKAPKVEEVASQLASEEADPSSSPSNSAEEPVTESPDSEAGGIVPSFPNGEANPSPSLDPEVSEDDSVPVFNGEAGMKQLSDEDRQALYAMVVSKLDQSQLKQLSDSLKGGLTSEELTQLESMLKATLTDEEYSQMMEILQSSKKTDLDPVSE